MKGSYLPFPLTNMRDINGWVESFPLTNMRDINGWVESLVVVAGLLILEGEK